MRLSLEDGFISLLGLKRFQNAIVILFMLNVGPLDVIELLL